MNQTRIFANCDEQTAVALLKLFDLAFEDDALPVSAAEVPEQPDQWSVSVYANSGDANAIADKMRVLSGKAGFALAFHLDELPEVDWVSETLRDLAAVRAGNYIVFGSHEKEVAKPHEIGILIDAGLAFGTGHHGTTAGCLEMLTVLAKKRQFQNILDLGTGSGVLAIAAAKTFTSRVLASDIDPVATETARENARINGTHSHVECITASGLKNRRFDEERPFDLVIANILARPLQSLALDIFQHTAFNGCLILSGLLPNQRAAIVATFRTHGFFFERAHYRDGWMTLVMTKG